MKKEIILGVFSLLIIIILISNVFAITASIGNARMVLRAETGDEIEKYILVKNVNEVRVDIELSASGDLEDYIEIKDDKFSLEPGQEKKAYFTIDVAKSGTSETKINVKFIPEKGNGVGFSSTVIVIAEKNPISILVMIIMFTFLLFVFLIIIIFTKSKGAEKTKPKKGVKKRD